MGTAIKPRSAQAAGINLYLIPGQVVEIYAEGYFTRTKDVKVKVDGVTEDVVLEHGFRILDESVGTIEVVPNKAAVVYTHKKAEANTIVFYSRTGEIGFCNITSVPIHTYFSDQEEESE
jgi:hypothetical protein